MQGLLLYSMDQSLIFDPTEFTTEITPDAVHAALKERHHLRALLIALRLRDGKLIQHALLSVPRHLVSSMLQRIAVFPCSQVAWLMA